MPFKVTKYFDIIVKDCDIINEIKPYIDYLRDNPDKAHDYYCYYKNNNKRMLRFVVSKFFRRWPWSMRFVNKVIKAIHVVELNKVYHNEMDYKIKYEYEHSPTIFPIYTYNIYKCKEEPIPLRYLLLKEKLDEISKNSAALNAWHDPLKGNLKAYVNLLCNEANITSHEFFEMRMYFTVWYRVNNYKKEINLIY